MPGLHARLLRQEQSKSTAFDNHPRILKTNCQETPFHDATDNFNNSFLTG
jgi:hypothetical protein